MVKKRLILTLIVLISPIVCGAILDDDLWDEGNFYPLKMLDGSQKSFKFYLIEPFTNNNVMQSLFENRGILGRDNLFDYSRRVEIYEDVIWDIVCQTKMATPRIQQGLQGLTGMSEDLNELVGAVSDFTEALEKLPDTDVKVPDNVLALLPKGHGLSSKLVDTVDGSGGNSALEGLSGFLKIWEGANLISNMALTHAIYEAIGNNLALERLEYLATLNLFTGALKEDTAWKEAINNVKVRLNTINDSNSWNDFFVVWEDTYEEVIGYGANFAYSLITNGWHPGWGLVPKAWGYFFTKTSAYEDGLHYGVVAATVYEKLGNHYSEDLIFNELYYYSQLTTYLYMIEGLENHGAFQGFVFSPDDEKRVNDVLSLYKIKYDWAVSEYEYAIKDHTVPLIDLVTPYEGYLYRTTVPITAEITDQSNIKHVEVSTSIDGSSWTVIDQVTNLTSLYSYSFDSSNIEYEDHFWFSIVAVDENDNRSPRKTTWVMIDNRVFEPGLTIDRTSIICNDVIVGQTCRVSYTVSNTGTAKLDWQVEESVSWIDEITPNSRSLGVGDSMSVSVLINTNGLSSNSTYNEYIYNTSNDRDINLPIVLTTVANGGVGDIPVTRNPSEDAHISEFNPDSTYNHTIINCDKYNGFDNVGLIKFDLSFLDYSRDVVTSANLDLYCSFYSNDNNDSQNLKIFRASTDWFETTATWNTNGTYRYSTIYDTINCSGTGWIRNLDVKSLVKTWNSSSNNNYGFYIGFDYPSSGTKRIRFDSSEGSNPPQLHVTYITKDEVPPNLSIVSPHNGQVVYSPNITVSGTAYDASGLDDIDVRVNEANWENASGLGSWSHQVTLQPGENKIEVDATDSTFEDTEKAVVVYYYPPDYHLSCYPSTMAIKQGKQGSNAVFLTSLNTFSSEVNLSLTGIPTGVVAYIENDAVIPTGATNIIFDVRDDVPIDTYPITLTSQTAGLADKTKTINLMVLDGIGPDISITAPTSEQFFETDMKNISIAGTSNDISGVIAMQISTGQDNVGANENWQFNVVLKDSWNTFTIKSYDTYGNFSEEVISIKYNPPLPEKAVISYPLDNQTDIPVNANLQWFSAANATIYNVYLGVSQQDVLDAVPETEGIYKGISETPLFSPGILSGEMQYFWRIDSENSAGYTKGDVWSYTTSAPVLIGDVNFDSVVDIFDLVLISGSYGRKIGDAGDPTWNFSGDGSVADNSDINKDGTIDIFDLVLVSSHFGESIN